MHYMLPAVINRVNMSYLFVVTRAPVVNSSYSAKFQALLIVSLKGPRLLNCSNLW